MELYPGEFIRILCYSFIVQQKGLRMLLKSKICFTVISLYEVTAVALLHCQRTCNAMFGMFFCDDWFRYFVFCVAIPIIAFLIFMWIWEIVRAHRRRHSLLHRIKGAVSNIADELKDVVQERLSPRDMERIISGAVLVGIKKYVDAHPDIKNMIARGLSDASIDIGYEADEVIRTKKKSGKKTSVSQKSKK